MEAILVGKRADKIRWESRLLAHDHKGPSRDLAAGLQ
jgi:hypothetical protein